MVNEKEWIDISKTKDVEEIRNTKEYKTWVKDVKERDGHCCVLCGLDKNIEAHHVESYKYNVDRRLITNNGITLCHWCHKKYHAIYDLEHTNIVTLLEFFKKYRF